MHEGSYLVDNVITLDQELPAEGERVFETQKDNQPYIEFSIFENDSNDLFVAPSIDVYGNAQYTDPELKVKRIGEVHLQLPPNTPKGAPIRVVFRSSTIGLEVTATNVETGESARIVIESEVINSGDDFKQAKSRLEGIQTSGEI